MYGGNCSLVEEKRERLRVKKREWKLRQPGTGVIGKIM